MLWGNEKKPVKQIMSKKDEEKPRREENRENRLERIKQLILERDEDAAKILKSWISNPDWKNKKS